MAINPSLLIAAPMLQNYFVDKETGLPLVAGVITCYQNNSYPTLKNWYYQNGTSPPYTYVALANPLILSSVGTIMDPSGKDTIPFFYPYDENDETIFQPYYITVVSSTGTFQFDRYNFPYVPNPFSAGSIPTYENYLLNNRFWRNIGSYGSTPVPIDLTNVTDMVVSPSQHDGFSMPDFQFIKNVGGASDTLTFLKFPLGSQFLEGDISGEYYLNHVCSSIESSETMKVYQMPVSLHIVTLESVQATFTLQAQSLGTTESSYVDIFCYQFLGTGVTSPDPTNITRFTLTPTFKKYTYSFTFPTATGASLSATGDDALYLQIGIPLSQACNISFALPSVFLSSSVPTNSFQTYDQIDTIINSWRTGDRRISSNFFLPGWVPANDGTIGNVGTGATARANQDTWPLYNYFWNNVNNNWAPVVGGRGSSAYDDFVGNKVMYLPRNLGRVLAGLNPLFSSSVNFTASANTVTFTTAHATNNQLTLGSAFSYSVAEPVQVFNTGGSLPGGLAASTIYYVCSTPTPGATIALSNTIENANNGIQITLTSDGSGTQNITTNYTLTLSIGTPLTTGTPIQVSNSGGALPGGLVANTVYYISSTSLTSTTVVLSKTLDDAYNGINYPITDNGSGTQTMQSALGAYIGESGTTDVAQHQHGLVAAAQIFWSSEPHGIPQSQYVTGGGFPMNLNYSPISTDQFGSNEMSLFQPTALCNIFIKL